MRIVARIGDRASEITITRSDGMFRVVVDGVERLVDARKLDADFYSILMDGRSYDVSVERQGSEYRIGHEASETVVEIADPSRRAGAEPRSRTAGSETVTSVMPGKVARVLVSVGDRVETGAGLVVIEAMKMENEITSPRSGRVAAVEVEQGKTVESGATLVIIES